MDDFSTGQFSTNDFIESFFSSTIDSTDRQIEQPDMSASNSYAHQNSTGYIDIVITYSQYEDKELIPNIPATFTSNGDILMSSLVSFMKAENFIGQDTMVFTYNPILSIYTYCGRGANLEELTVPSEHLTDFSSRKALNIKVREPEKSILKFHQAPQMVSTTYEKPESIESYNVTPAIKSQETHNNIYYSTDEGTAISNNDNLSNYDSVCKNEEVPTSPSGKTPRRRNQERLVSDVLEIIEQWRTLYNGTQDPQTGEHIQLSLHDAADRIGVPKKSLDDYQMIIKKAKTFDFDFNKHLDCKFGVVRSFVRKNCGSVTRRRKNKSKCENDEEDYMEGQDKPKKCYKSKKIVKY